MKLTYRGNYYQSFDRINSNLNLTDRLPFKLIYRSQAYYYNSRSVAASEDISQAGQM
jgi:lipoprotein NlpI